MKLTIIVMVFNEQKTIKRAIDDVRALDIDKEIIVIDNCSTDGTIDILEDLDYEDIKIVYQEKNLGPGNTVQSGIDIANGEYIFIQMSDLEYDHRRSLIMLDIAEKEGCDAVFGSRLQGYLKSGTKNRIAMIKEYPPFLATVITTFLVNKFFGYNFTDIIGTKLYRTASVRKLSRCTNSTGFEFEHVSKMCKRKLKIGEVDIDYKPRENPKEKKIKPYHMINALFAIIKVKFSLFN